MSIAALQRPSIAHENDARTSRAILSRLALPIGWIVSRIIMLGLAGPLNLRIFAPVGNYGDVASVYFNAYAHMHHGALPYTGFAYEYPPGTLLPLLLLPAHLASTQFVWVWELEMVCVDALILVGICKLGSLAGAPRRVVHLSAWAWIIAGVSLMGITLGRNDLLPCALVVWAFVFVYQRRFAGCGALLALGFITKAWPIFLLALLVVGYREGRRQLLAGAAAVVALFTVVLTATGTLAKCLDYLVFYHGSRGLEIESLPAFPTMLAACIAHNGVSFNFEFGSANLNGEDWLVTLSTIATLVLIALAVFVTRARRNAPSQSLATMTIASVAIIAGSLVTTKVLSPQYLVWLVVVACVSAAVGALPPALLGLAVCAAGLTGVFYPSQWNGLFLDDLNTVLLLGARDLVLIVMALATMRLTVTSARNPGPASS